MGEYSEKGWIFQDALTSLLSVYLVTCARMLTACGVLPYLAASVAHTQPSWLHPRSGSRCPLSLLVGPLCPASLWQVLHVALPLCSGCLSCSLRSCHQHAAPWTCTDLCTSLNSSCSDPPFNGRQPYCTSLSCAEGCTLLCDKTRASHPPQTWLNGVPGLTHPSVVG